MHGGGRPVLGQVHASAKEPHEVHACWRCAAAAVMRRPDTGACRPMYGSCGQGGAWVMSAGERWAAASHVILICSSAPLHRARE